MLADLQSSNAIYRPQVGIVSIISTIKMKDHTRNDKTQSHAGLLPGAEQQSLE